VQDILLLCRDAESRREGYYRCAYFVTLRYLSLYWIFFLEDCVKYDLTHGPVSCGGQLSRTKGDPYRVSVLSHCMDSASWCTRRGVVSQSRDIATLCAHPLVKRGGFAITPLHSPALVIWLWKV
jgi:hypothetical protein